ncbi:MAG: hypothetical protein R2911_30975 [Caldilineaceae bacterium]
MPRRRPQRLLDAAADEPHFASMRVGPAQSNTTQAAELFSNITITPLSDPTAGTPTPATDTAAVAAAVEPTATANVDAAATAIATATSTPRSVAQAADAGEPTATTASDANNATPTTAATRAATATSARHQYTRTNGDGNQCSGASGNQYSCPYDDGHRPSHGHARATATARPSGDNCPHKHQYAAKSGPGGVNSRRY